MWSSAVDVDLDVVAVRAVLCAGDSGSAGGARGAVGVRCRRRRSPHQADDAVSRRRVTGCFSGHSSRLVMTPDREEPCRHAATVKTVPSRAGG